MKDVRVINSFDEFKEYLKAFLCFFDDFCRKNDIEYTVLAGTMLGTIRNKGLIPWDGDVDVALTRKEIEKLKTAFSNYNGRYYLNYPGHFYHKRTKDEQHPYYCRIIDKKCPSPYFLIDVYSIDYLGDDYDKAVEGVQKLTKLEDRAVVGPMFHLPAIEKDKGWKRNLVALAMHVFHPFLYPVSWILTPFVSRKIQKVEKEYFEYDENSKYEIVEATFGRYPVKENILLSKGISDYDFENFKVRCINNYEVYLTTVYKNYMALPPKEKQVPFPSSLLNSKYKIIYDDELLTYLKKIDSFLVKDELKDK